MLKSSLFIIIFNSFFQLVIGQQNNGESPKPNFIDQLNSAEQINEFIYSIDSNYKGFKTYEKLKYDHIDCQKLSDSLHIKPWTKSDIDNNGLTDILVNGKFYDHSVLCVFDLGEKYMLRDLSYLARGCKFPILAGNVIRYCSSEKNVTTDIQGKLDFNEVRLIYKFGDLIEENKNPLKDSIEKIFYITSGGYNQPTARYRIIINSDGKSEWRADHRNVIRNKEFNGNYNSTIDTHNFNTIYSLLHYIDFENHNDHLHGLGCSLEHSTLQINYKNGKIKYLDFIDQIGNFGIDHLCKLISNLRENQKWKKNKKQS